MQLEVHFLEVKVGNDYHPFLSLWLRSRWTLTRYAAADYVSLRIQCVSKLRQQVWRVYY
jgi:hypothetical protein